MQFHTRQPKKAESPQNNWKLITPAGSLQLLSSDVDVHAFFALESHDSL